MASLAHAMQQILAIRRVDGLVDSVEAWALAMLNLRRGMKQTR